MQAQELMIVTLTVNQNQEAEFTRFYQHEFLPAILDAVPEFTSVRRYEVCDELNRQSRTLSVYEIAGGDVAEAAFTGFSRPALADVVAQFGRWKETDFSDFTRVLYKPIYEHRRRPVDGAFASRPLVAVTTEVKSEVLAGFHEWLHHNYVPRLMADVPSVAACRQYQSSGTDPIRYVMIYEFPDEQRLHRGLQEMAAHHRCQENEALEKWESLAVEFKETSIYRQTYRLPG